MVAMTPPPRRDRVVRGEVVPGSEPARGRSPDGARRRSHVGGLVRLAWRLGGRVRRPAATVATLAAPLAAPLGRIAGEAGWTGPVVSLRVDGRDQPVVPEVVARLARDGSGRVVVLVPASGGDERTWLRGIDDTGATYGDRLAALLGWSPVSLRHAPRGHDTGVAVVDGSLALGSLLQRLVDAWPVPVTRLVLIAAGDGALLARGALGVRRPEPRAWTDLVTELVALGAPQLGVSAGSNWGVGGRLEDELAGLVRLGPDVLDVPPLDHVGHLLVDDRGSGRLHPAGQLLRGVLRWRRRSRRVHDLFPSAARFEVSAGRRPLVNHPEIHEALLCWLA